MIEENFANLRTVQLYLDSWRFQSCDDFRYQNILTLNITANSDPKDGDPSCYDLWRIVNYDDISACLFYSALRVLVSGPLLWSSDDRTCKDLGSKHHFILFPFNFSPTRIKDQARNASFRIGIILALSENHALISFSIWGSSPLHDRPCCILSCPPAQM